MSIFSAFLFIITAAECLSRFFYTSRNGVSPIAILIFIVLAPTALSVGLFVNSDKNFSFSSELVEQCLAAILPLIVASLTFSALQAVLTMSVSKEIASIVQIFRPIWLVGFVILVLRKLTPIAAAILVGAPRS